MAGIQIDIERVVAVLSEATADGAEWSQRGLAKAAGEGRDCVADIVKGRNKNPTLKVLTNLASAMGGDLSLFAPTTDFRADPPTGDELEQALREMLPDMPRGSVEKRVRFLADALGHALRLPPGRPANQTFGSQPVHAEGAPPRAATN